MPFAAWADYGLIPKEKGLFLKLGMDYFHSSQNYNSDGQVEDIQLNGFLADLTEYRFYLEPELAITEDLALRARFNFISNQLNPTDEPDLDGIAGSGLGDIVAGVKYRVRNKSPQLTLETTFKVPTYSNIVDNVDDLLVGDGNVDVGLLLHSAFGSGRFFGTLTPGLLFRSGGFSSALTLGLSGGVRFNPAYAYLFMNSIISLGNSILYDSSEDVHDAEGSGGSYSKLSGSPTGFDLGLKLGVRVAQSVFIESTFTKSLGGRRYPEFFQAGLNLLTILDFYQPDTRKKIREVPFDSNPEAPPVPEAEPPPAS